MVIGIITLIGRSVTLGMRGMLFACLSFRGYPHAVSASGWSEKMTCPDSKCGYSDSLSVLHINSDQRTRIRGARNKIAYIT